MRKYYRQDLGDRLRRLFAADERPQIAARREPDSDSRPRSSSDGAGQWGEPGRNWPIAVARLARLAGGEPYVVASPQLAASPIIAAHRAAIPRREALILQAVINHPWLLHEHLEELAGLEFRHADAAR